MTDDTVDSWFVRFRQTGDPAALALVFDQTAPEILRLAGHLVRDPHVAEDLLQQTFLTAIERAANFDEERRVRPWLIGILVQLVRRHHRARGRQPHADRLPVRSAESPVDHAEAAELSATLEQELGRLPEPYQPVLALHLRHGLSAHEIASALRRPQGTVRTQLMRGLELLRRALPVGLAVTAVFGAGAAQTLATVRAAVLTQAGGSVVAAAAGPALLGGVLVGKNVGVAAAVIVALVGAGLWLWPAARPATPPEPVAAVMPAPQRAAPETPASAPAARRQPDVVESRPTVAGGTGTLAVRVLWSDRTPAADVGVLVRPVTGDGDLHRRWCDAGPAGELRLDGLTPGRYSLATDRGGRITSEVRADTTTQAELLVPAGVQVECQVVDREGAPIPQAMVWLALHAESVDDGRVVGRTGADGMLRLRDVEPGRLVSAAARTFVWCRCQFVEGAPGARQSLRLILRGVGATLRGRVVDAEGTPVAGCLVRLGQSSPVQRVDKVFGVPALPWTTCTDAAGTFRVEHLSWRDLPIWARAPGFAIATARVQLAEDRDNEVVIRLVRGGSLAGVVLDAEGKPCLARVSAQGEAGGGTPTSSFQSPGWAWPFPGVATDAEGRFRLAELRPGLTLFRAEAETGGWAQSELRIEDGKELHWEARLTRGADITGIVVDASDKPLDGWRVIATASTDGRQGEARTAADGRFTITGREQVAHKLSVSPQHGGLVRAGVHEATPGQPPLTIRVPADQLPTAFLTCTVADPEGRPLRDARVTPHRAGTLDSLSATADADTGRFKAGPMPPGRYVVHVAHEKFGNLRSEEIALAADETRDAGELRFPQPGTFVATVKDPEGRPVSGIAVLQEPGSPYPATMGMLSDGVLRSKPVRPGNYVLALFRAESPLCGWPVEIRPGQVTPVEAQIPKGVRRAVRYTRLGEPAPASLTFRWFDARGVLIQCTIQQWDQAERPGHDQWFAPGTWRVVVESASGRTAETTIVIPDLSPSSEELLIRLP